MSKIAKDDKVFVPGSKKNIVPFMRDVFTIPTNARQKPNLIGSVCTECEEYFFPKTGQKATCDNPFCPRSTKETLLSGRGKILSATVTRSSVEGNEVERVSAVILLEEGIKVNSPLIGWEGFEYLLVPGTPVEVVLQEMGETEGGDVIVGYAFRLVTGRKKPQFSQEEEEVAPEAVPLVEASEPAEEPKPKEAPAVEAVVEAKKKTREASKKTVKKKAAKKPIKKKIPIKKKTAKKPAKKKVVKKKTSKKPVKKKAAVKSKKKVPVKKSAKKKAPPKKAKSKSSKSKKKAAKKTKSRRT